MGDIDFLVATSFGSGPDMFVGIPGCGTPLARDCDFRLDSMKILKTRSRSQDTVFVSVTLSTTSGFNQTIVRGLGDLSEGSVNVGVSFVGVMISPFDSAVFSYAIVNAGHTDSEEQVEAGLQQVTNQLTDTAIRKIATEVGGSIGAAVGAEIGTAAVPLIGTALGALAGFIVGSVTGLIVANCDGPVAAGLHPLSGREILLATNDGQVLTSSDDHPGTESPAGCGENSHYIVSWSAAPH